MSADRIAAICDWPTADRRRLVRQLQLVGPDGAEIDYRDVTAFWNAIILYFSNVSNYKTLNSHLKQLSKKAYRRSLHMKAFDRLHAKVHFPRSLFTDSGGDKFLSGVVTYAVDCDAFGELSDWLWAAWLDGESAQSIAEVIDGYKPLKDRFGSWRPPTEAMCNGASTEKNDQATTEPTTEEHVAALFRNARESIDEAERLQSDEPLATALAEIEELAGLLRSRKEEGEGLQSALAEFNAAFDRLRNREQLTDKQAAARLRTALERFTQPTPGMPYVEVKSLADKITQLIDVADAARSAWRACDAAHRDSPFDRELRRNCIDALELYEQAEGNLAGFIEGATSGETESTTTEPSNDAEASMPIDEGESTANGAATVGSTEPVTPGLISNDESDAEPKCTSPNLLSGDIEEPSTDILSPEQESDIAGTAQEVEPNAVAPPIDLPGVSEPTEGSEDATRLAATFLDRGDIGLFEIACTAGGILNYQLPHPMLARLLGLSGSQDAETQLSFTEALQDLPATAPHGLIHQGETWLRLAALSLPAITDTTLLCREALENLKLADPFSFEPKSLQAAILSLGRAYPTLEGFAQTSAPEAEQELIDAKADLRQYVGQLKESRLAYQAATVVAHKLAQDFDRIATAQSLDPNAVEGMINAVMRADEVDEAIIRRFDKEARGASAERRPIEARALTRLKDIIKELRTRTARLTRAAELLREQRRSNAQTIEATRRKGRDLHRHFEATAEAFERLAKSQSGISAFSAACALVASRLLRDHAQAFTTGTVTNPFREALDCDRFRLPAGTCLPELNPEATWEALRQLSLKPAMNWLEAFDVALDRREHLATGVLLPLAIPLANGRSLKSERDEAIVAARNYVENARTRLRDDLLTVMNYASTIETSLDPLYQGVAEIDVKELPRSDANIATAINGHAILDFPDALDEIEAAGASVRRVRTRALKTLEDRISKLEGTAPTDTIASFRKLVESDDLITLAEELSLVERGQDIKIATTGPIAIEEYSRFLISAESANPRLAEWESSQDFPRESRARMLVRKWLQLRTAQGESINRAVRDVLGELGFAPEKEPSVVPGGTLRGSRIRQLSAKVRIIADREFCSVARFGSEAEGQYKIVLASQDALPNEIVTSVSEIDAGATLIFVQQWLTQEDRRTIAAEARRLRRSFCLVDDGLLAFLCTRQHILRDLFACGIPFAAATPYVTTPGSIPVEAFFGRNAEIGEIRSRNGSCIVYGGRQLGKSVLLDHIEKRSGFLDKSITRRFDCQGLTDRREILALIDRKARPASANSRLDILAAMEQWLGEDAERTILLMLDETNRFVRADALRDFQVLVEFRGLMERTNRRFKVVLSGQNNVLRLTQQPNTPLAHFGHPICIGPLKGADYKAARDLVTEPLAAVGYVFDSPQLVSRILVETQFYPKLVQMFCRDLLAHVRELPAMHKGLPPWHINGEHIEATLRNQKLRTEIFDTFRITLELDKRYELVALIMAVDRSDRRKRGDIATSMTEEKLREDAFYWWSEGFAATNAREDFRGVLEELEGLGILTHDRATGTYQLSSPIIANLIGSEAEVYDRLIAFAQQPAPHEMEPSKRRARVASMSEPKHKGIWLLPLTPAQISKATRSSESETAQMRPTLLFGAPDMLLDQVKDALEPKKYDEHEGLGIVLVDQPANAASLMRQINDAKRKRCFVVSPRLRWDTAWINAVHGSAGNNPVVFVGNLDHAWRVIVEDPKGLRQFANLRIETLAPLAPIEIDDQCQRRKITLSDDDRSTLLAETGGFLQSVGYWTDRHFGTKREASSVQEVIPRFDPLPDSARALLAELISYMQPDDTFDVALLSDCCRGQNPARVFDWLMLTGLAEPIVREVENLRLNRVFWSPPVREALERVK
jgi:hypothetical protein